MTRIDDRVLTLYELDGDTSFLVSGSELLETIELEERWGTGKVMVFFDPYKRTKTDVVFFEDGNDRGTLWISEPYGENMDRKTIFYYKNKEGKVSYNERF